VAGPGQPKVCEAGNEVYNVGKTTIGNTSTSTPATLHDVTKRDENAFGEKYPSSVLKYLPKEGTGKGKQTGGKQGAGTTKGKKQ
jgi:hypothetical protein